MNRKHSQSIPAGDALRTHFSRMAAELTPGEETLASLRTRLAAQPSRPPRPALPFLAAALAACLLLGGSLFAAARLADRQENAAPPDVTPPAISADTAPPAVGDPPADTSADVILPWERGNVAARYPFLSFGTASYCTTGRQLDAEAVGEALGAGVATGHDPSRDLDVSSACRLYRLKGFAARCALAVRYDDADGFWVALCEEYVPADLGELVADFSLREELKVSFIYYLPDHVRTFDADTLLWGEHGLFTVSPEAGNAGEQFPPDSPLLVITGSLPALGLEGCWITLSRDGILYASLATRCFTFPIGREAAERLLSGLPDAAAILPE